MAHRLLVVSGDNEVLRSLPSHIEDVEVKQIESANDALWEVRTAPPAAIIADTDLPDMSGLDMAEILPSFDVSTRIILWSRDPNMPGQERLNGLGVYQLLQGAITHDELQAIIREAVIASAEAESARAAQIAAEEEAADFAEVEEIEEHTATEPIEQALSQDETASAPAEQVTPETPAKSVAEPVEAVAKPEERDTFTPARVRLPSRADRIAALAREAAAERLAEATPLPPPTPSPPAPVDLSQSSQSIGGYPSKRSGGNKMVLTADNLNPIRSIMSQLSQELGPQCILLTDRAGMVLVEVGSTDTLPTMILLPLLSTSFSTAGEVARQLGEEDATTLYIHEGVNYDLYCFDISQRFLFVLVFNKKVASSKIGAVWVNTKRAIRELQDALS